MKKINWSEYIQRGIIIFIVIFGAFTPMTGFASIGSFYLLIYFILIVYYLISLIKAVFSKKKENKKNRLWYLIILIIILIPMRAPLQTIVLEKVKDYTIILHTNCNNQNECPKVKDLPWTNGAISFKATNNDFEIFHIHMESVHKFKGGIGKDLVYTYYWADHPDKKESIYKYVDNEWVKINDGYFN